MMKAYLVGVVMLYSDSFIGPPQYGERIRTYNIEFERFGAYNLTVCYDRRRIMRDVWKNYFHAFECKGELQP